MKKHPEVGDTYWTDFPMEVTSIRTDSTGTYLSGWVKIDEFEGRSFVAGIPLIAASHFDPVKDSEEHCCGGGCE